LPDEPSTDIVSPDAFAARLDALAPSEPASAAARFAIAVSGGRDSMALALLSRAYAQRTGARVLALTVDHGLRAGSGAAARRCAAWCAALGFETRILQWRGDKPGSGVQAAARGARYRLLAEACAAHRVDALMTAHSADDQAETVFMRLRRGAGAAGLSAMAEASRIAAGAGAPVRLLRPLLPFSRAQLTASVRAAGQDFLDDPANDDPAFERVRVRALLAALDEQALLTPAALGRTAARLRDADRRLRAAEARLFDRLGGCFHGWGGVSLDRADAAAPDMGGLAARLIHAASGEAHPPGADEAFNALVAARGTGAATLAGALIRTARGRVWFLREPAALLGRSGVAPAPSAPLTGPTLWDGRFILRPLDQEKAFAVEPLGRNLASLGARRALLAAPAAGAAGAPAIYCDGALIGVAGASFGRVTGFACEALAQERFAGEIIRF